MTHPDSQVELAGALTRLLAAVGHRGGVTVEGLRRLSGGASRETWSFLAVEPAGDRQALILQLVRPGLALGGPSLATEDALLAAARQAGVPVPDVVADAEMVSAFVGEGRVTAHVGGETLGPRIVRHQRFAAARTVLAGQCARALAAIHSIDPAEAPGLEPVDTLGRLRDGLDLVGEARPAFELALRWLADNRPPPGPVSVVHGDFRVGNLIVDETGLGAVLDWELAHLGDPLEDLGWLCVRAWRFGGEGEVGGVAPLAELLTAYAEATGRGVDPDAVRWWIVAGTLTWGLICAVQTRRHLDGHVRSVELAAIGRRVCETEYDLLQLLAPTAPEAAEAGDAGPGPSPPARTPEAIHEPDGHGRPTAAELVDAVREHLAEAVAPTLSGAAAFQLKVAGNALAIVARELSEPLITAATAEVRRSALAGLGVADEAALAAAIRSGSLDAGPAVVSVIRPAVVDRVRVANPRWLEGSDRSWIP